MIFGSCSREILIFGTCNVEIFTQGDEEVRLVKVSFRKGTSTSTKTKRNIFIKHVSIFLHKRSILGNFGISQHVLDFHTLRVQRSWAEHINGF